VDDEGLLELCGEVVDAVSRSLETVDDWSAGGIRPGQYAIDLAADSAALEVLDRADVGVLSEESGLRRPDAPVLVVIDPVDGSTNASRGIPWYACSLCVLDSEGPRVALVANLVSRARYTAIRGGGALRDGSPIEPSGCREIGEAVVALSGYPHRRMGWSQYRALGAAALDLCSVAEGVVDAYAVVGGSRLGAWDYLGAMLVCKEAGASVREVDGLDLVTTEHAARRSPAAAATSTLLTQVADGVLTARVDNGDG
jgi:myo-inositol-1(or 4)-monophosphatase